MSQPPLVATLNSYDGRVVGNAAIVSAGTDGLRSVSVYVTNDTDVIIDMNGYFLPQMSNADAEVPSGAIDGTNSVFSLASTPANGTTPLIAKNGTVLKPGLDYPLAGNNITFLVAAVPQPGDVLLAWYRQY
jgi:hypothetical protein